MKKTLEKLESIKELVENKIEKMDEIFNSRTDKWQESEKGEAFQEKIDMLVEVQNNLDVTIDSLNEFLEM